MNLGDLGEFGLIDKVRAWLPASDADVGIGDDAAVVRIRAGAALVATTDTLVEGVHFRLDWSQAADVGFKAVSVNVSDLAAMGAEPRWLLVALCAPGEVSEEVVHGFYGGMIEAGAMYGTEVIGGDTVRAKEIVITVTALGELDGEPMRRSSARVGDVLAVSGPLGRASAGFNLLLSNSPERVVPEDAMACIDAHRRPVARAREGRKLRESGVRTALDISDGLASDVRRLAEASGVGVEIEEKLIPIASEARSVAEDRGWDAVQMVLGGGEDLELLVAAPPSAVERLGLLPIGRVIDDGVWLVRDGERVELPASGFDHFRHPEAKRRR